MNCRAFSLCLALITIAAQARVVSAQSPSVKLSVTLLNDPTISGDNFTFVYILSNLMDHDLNVSSRFIDGSAVDSNFKYELNNQFGKTMPPLQLPLRLGSTDSIRSYRIPAGGSDQKTAIISPHDFDFSGPGEYSLRLGYPNPNDRGKTFVYSNTILIHVIPRPTSGSK